MLGGPKTAGVGWAAGVDRLADLCESNFSTPKQDTIYCFAAVGPKSELEAAHITSHFVAKNKKCLSFQTGNLKKKLEKISKLSSTTETLFAILIFDHENENVEYKIKNFKTGEEKVLTKAELLSS